MWITTAWQHNSPEVTVKGFKKCCICNVVMELMTICCGMLAVSVRKMKALTVKMETVTVTGNGGQNLTCFVY